MTIETVLKIRNKTTGLFSTGGERPSWHETGKQWKAKGPLHNHLNYIKGNTYDDAEIVLFELKEVHSEFSDTNLGEYVAQREHERTLKQAEYKLQVQEEQRQREIRNALKVLEENGINVK